MANTNVRHVVTNEVRLSYVHLLQPHQKPGQDPKFSVTVLVPKNDVQTMQRIGAAIEAAIQSGVEMWKGRPAILAIPVHDGDGVRPSDGEPFGAECRGHWVFTASTKPVNPPRIVDANVQDLMDPRRIYSGVYARVGIDFFPFNSNGKKGVGVGLTNVQILRDGEPLGNRTSAEDDFGGGQAQPAYGQPARPAYQAPQQQPAYGQPAQPAYQAPQQGFAQQYNQAGQPAFQQPQQAAYQTPQQQGFAQQYNQTGQPAYQQPQQQAYSQAPQQGFAQQYGQAQQQPAYGQNPELPF